MQKIEICLRNMTDQNLAICKHFITLIKKKLKLHNSALRIELKDVDKSRVTRMTSDTPFASTSYNSNNMHMHNNNNNNIHYDSGNNNSNVNSGNSSPYVVTSVVTGVITNTRRVGSISNICLYIGFFM